MQKLKRSLGPPVELPPPCDEPTQMALKALQAGNASSGQQQMALKWIVSDCAKTHDEPFRPGPEGPRDTTFALGKAFVGRQIVKQLNTVRVTKEKSA